MMHFKRVNHISVATDWYEAAEAVSGISTCMKTARNLPNSYPAPAKSFFFVATDIL